MSFKLCRPRVALQGDRALRIALDLEVIPGTSGQAGGQLALGWQLFDSETESWIMDGPRCVLRAGEEPLDRHGYELAAELPLEPGRYCLFVSLIEESSGWQYQQGWPFLLIEAEVSAGRAKLLRYGLVTRAQLRRQRWLRALGRFFSYPLVCIWRHRRLIRSMVRRDISGRYSGSFVGLFWTVLNPLLLMITYFFVFGVVLRARLGNDPSRSGFALYFLAGMLPWLPFAEAAGRAPFVILEHRNFVKKLVFPVETLPVNLVLAGLVTEGFALILFLCGLVLLRGALPWTAMWLPALIAPQVLFTAGVCWFLAAVGVYLRDLGQVIGFLLTLWFFLTPICYPVESLPAAALPLLSKNPLFVLVRGYRAVLLEHAAPAWGSLWKLWAVSGLVFFVGHACFYKLKKNFADVI